MSKSVETATSLAVFCALSLVGGSSAHAETCIVADPTGTPLNVRASPNGAKRATLPNGMIVVIQQTSFLNGKQWAVIGLPSGRRIGWVFREFVSCNPGQSAANGGANVGGAGGAGGSSTVIINGGTVYLSNQGGAGGGGGSIRRR